MVEQEEQARPDRASQSRQQHGAAENDVSWLHHTPYTGRWTRRCSQDPCRWQPPRVYPILWRLQVCCQTAAGSYMPGHRGSLQRRTKGMDVGMMMVFASYGWDHCPDAQVWDEELRLARLAVDAGFDCLWSAEH